jgi:xanthine dehydrogenase YagS FAD-binding subunit
MRPFEYVSPNSTTQAIRLLAANWGNTEVLAGGTDLLALMKDDVLAPKRLVNIKDIADLRGISSNAQGLRVGALTTLREMADNEDVKKSYPALSEALLEAASPQIRNMATIGGNLCQRPRCWYFRNGMGLLPKDQSGKELVTVGENRYHAILGNQGSAKFVSPSTVVPMLIAYGAKIRLEGLKGKRDLPLERFFVIPKNENEREHDLRPNEILTELVIPPATDLIAAHYEIRQKDAFDWPLAVVAVTLRLQGSNVKSSKIVLGYVAPVPWPSTEAQQAMAGKPINKANAQKAAEAALSKASPLSHNAYKVKLAKVAVARAILKAAGGSA